MAYPADYRASGKTNQDFSISVQATLIERLEIKQICLIEIPHRIRVLACLMITGRYCKCTVLVIIKLTEFSVSVRFSCSCSQLIIVFISSYFAMLNNVVHSLEPGETPSNSASHQAPNYVQRS